MIYIILILVIILALKTEIKNGKIIFNVFKKAQAKKFKKIW